MACSFFDVIAMLDRCTSRYTTGGIHIESYLVLVSSCNLYVVINESVMIIIIRALSQRGKDDGDYDYPTSWDETLGEK